MTAVAKEELFATVKVQREITKYQVACLLVGLFENRFSSWLRDVLTRELAPGLVSEDFQKGGKMQLPPYYFHPYQLIPMTEGCALILEVDDPNGDGEETKEFRMTPETVQKGLQVMAEKYPKHFQDFLDENDDANTSDIFGQCIVYGEEVFS